MAKDNRMLQGRHEVSAGNYMHTFPVKPLTPSARLGRVGKVVHNAVNLTATVLHWISNPFAASFRVYKRTVSKKAQKDAHTAISTTERRHQTEVRHDQEN